MQVGSVVDGDADDAGLEIARDLRAQLHGRAVRGDRDGGSVANPARARIVGRELDDRIRPLEVQFRRALDGRAGEEGAIRDEAEATGRLLFAPGTRLARLRLRRALRELGALADLGVGDAA